MVDTVRMLIRFELSEPAEAILIERLSRDLKFLREDGFEGPNFLPTLSRNLLTKNGDIAMKEDIIPFFRPLIMLSRWILHSSVPCRFPFSFSSFQSILVLSLSQTEAIFLNFRLIVRFIGMDVFYD